MTTDKTFTINDMDYTFFAATMNGMAVIGVSYTRNGESFAEWSDEAWLPENKKQAEVMLAQFGWEIVSSSDDFREVHPPHKDKEQKGDNQSITKTKWTSAGSGTGGTEGYPGDHYHMVHLEIYHRADGSEWKIAVSEVAGSNQGYLEEHSRKKISGRGSDYAEARSDLLTAAEDAEFNMSLLREALAETEEEMDEEE